MFNDLGGDLIISDGGMIFVKLLNKFKRIPCAIDSDHFTENHFYFI